MGAGFGIRRSFCAGDPTAILALAGSTSSSKPHRFVSRRSWVVEANQLT
jgi:hypothetical protein